MDHYIQHNIHLIQLIPFYLLQIILNLEDHILHLLVLSFHRLDILFFINYPFFIFNWIISHLLKFNYLGKKISIGNPILIINKTYSIIFSSLSIFSNTLFKYSFLKSVFLKFLFFNNSIFSLLNKHLFL